MRLLHTGFPRLPLKSGLTGGVLLASQWIAPVQAQIIPDSTAGTQLNSSCAVTYCIEGGTLLDNRRLHSFEQFSLGTNETVYFQNASGLAAILSRVTGGTASRLDGKIRADGTADFFLINPAGILFGPNASLQLGGSFYASTASGLTLSDGSEFSAIAPQPPNLLTVSTPVGLQFGSSANSPITDPNAGLIQVAGTGNQYSTDPQFFILDRSNRPEGLAVAAGKTLLLAAPNIDLVGGNLTAPSGTLNLWALSDGSLDLTQGPQPGQALGNITLRQASGDVSGDRPGSISLQGNRIALLEGSGLVSNTTGGTSSTPGGQISITANEALTLIGQGQGQFSFIRADVEFGAAGQGSSILVKTPQLTLQQSGVLTVNTYDLGTAGLLRIEADQIDLENFGSGIFSSVFSPSSAAGVEIATQRMNLRDGATLLSYSAGPGQASPLRIDASEYLHILGTSAQGVPSGLFSYAFATGAGGDISVKTPELGLTDGGNIAAIALDSGNSGSINITADRVKLEGLSIVDSPSGIFSQTYGSGNGGEVHLTVDQLTALNGGTVSVSTYGAGQGGVLDIKARAVVLTGLGNTDNLSGLFAQAQGNATGSGGMLKIDTDTLQITGGARAAVSTFSSGDGGQLLVQANQIQIDGVSPDDASPSGLFALVQPNATGNGGQLIVETNQLQITGGGQIAVSTLGAGNAGDLIVRAQDRIELVGGGTANGRSGLFANAILGTGNGGTVTVETRDLSLQTGATISASNFQSQGLLPPGNGSAGSLNLTADIISLDHSTLTAGSAGGDQGNIALLSNLLVLRNGSRIYTDAQGDATGGNIQIKTGFLIAPADENSDITANAASNFGGQVEIAAQRIFGIQFREQLTPNSDITASSGLGAQFDGTVELETPGIDPSQSLPELPDQLVDANQQIVAQCGQATQGTFVTTGRGGLPTNPQATLNAGSLWQDSRTASASTDVPGVPSSTLQEAQGWSLNAQSQVVLTPSSHPLSSRATAAPSCAARLPETKT